MGIGLCPYFLNGFADELVGALFPFVIVLL